MDGTGDAALSAPRRQLQCLMVVGLHAFARNVAAQTEIESKPQQFNVLQFQAINPRRFQRGFHGVNLHRPTVM
jgi:hypothetical protein